MTSAYLCLGYGVLHENLEGGYNEGLGATSNQNDMPHNIPNLEHKKSQFLRREGTLYGEAPQPN